MTLRIVLVRPKMAANIGSVARIMKNFGLSDLVLVAPRCALDRSAYALASHAAEILDGSRSVPRLEDALQDMHTVLATTARLRDDEGLPLLTPREAAPTLAPDRTAVVFGPEDHGLSRQDLVRCSAAIRIPTADYASINLAQAVNVVAYEAFLATAADATRPSAPEPALRSRQESMYQELLELLHYIGYTDRQRERSAMRLFRRLLDRAAPSEREVAALRGLWSQARWAADQPPERLPGRRGD